MICETNFLNYYAPRMYHMKTITKHKLLPAGFCLLAALPALAIEPPRDDAPPPPSVRKDLPSAPAEAENKGQRGFDTPVRDRVSRPERNVAYIGLITAEVPDLLAVHVGLQEREGVLIRELAPGGPAEKAGFEKFDIITRVGGKAVGSPEEFSEVIAANKPEAEIAIDFIHQGKSATKNVKLETRPAPAQANRPDPLDSLDLGNLPDEQARRIRDLIDRRLRGIREQQDELEKSFGFSETPGRGVKGFQFRSDATFRLMDENGSIEMKSSDGSKEITVRDRANKITWSGPWDTDQDKAAAPKEIRDRIDKFKLDDNFRGNGFRFRMGPGAGFDNE
jgi:serine protease Do